MYTTSSMLTPKHAVQVETFGMAISAFGPYEASEVEKIIKAYALDDVVEVRRPGAPHGTPYGYVLAAKDSRHDGTMWFEINYDDQNVAIFDDRIVSVDFVVDVVRYALQVGDQDADVPVDPSLPGPSFMSISYRNKVLEVDLDDDGSSAAPDAVPLTWATIMSFLR